MKKKILIGLIVLIIIVLLLTPVMAKGKKDAPGQNKDTAATTVETLPSTPTSAVAPVPVSPVSQPTVPTIIQVTAPETNATAQEEGTDWEMVGAIVGILAIIGALIGWYFSRKKRSKSSHYLKDINETFNEFKSDTSKCEANLYILKEKIEKEFTEGKIDEQSLQLLHGRIEKYLKNVRLGIVDGLDVSQDAKKELANMLKDGKITEEEYNEFIKSKSLSKKDKDLLSKHMAKWKKKDK